MNATDKKNVIVTGGAGFLGTHLVKALIEKGYRVIVIDNLENGKKPDEHKDLVFIQAGICSTQDYFHAFAGAQTGGGIYGVFHLAALPRVQYSIDYPERSHDVNVNGTLQVLLMAALYGARRFVYSSSSSVYGPCDTMSFEDDETRPMSPYATQKLAAENYVRNFCMIPKLGGGMEAVCLRYFNIYGPGADPDGPYAQAIIKFVAQRSRGQRLTVTGDGLQKRDSVHVTDVVRANIAALESGHVGKGEVINIGSGRPVSVREMARMVGGEVTFIEKRIEPRLTHAAIEKAAKLLGWEPEVLLEDGIAELKQIYGIKD